MKPFDPRSRDLPKIAEQVHLLSRTRDGEVTLTASAATTTVTDPTVTPDSVLYFDPVTANAATELNAAPATMYVLAADRLLGSFTITHSNSAVADRTFRWAALGD